MFINEPPIHSILAAVPLQRGATPMPGGRARRSAAPHRFPAAPLPRPPALPPSPLRPAQRRRAVCRRCSLLLLVAGKRPWWSSTGGRPWPPGLRWVDRLSALSLSPLLTVSPMENGHRCALAAERRSTAPEPYRPARVGADAGPRLPRATWRPPHAAVVSLLRPGAGLEYSRRGHIINGPDLQGGL